MNIGRNSVRLIIDQLHWAVIGIIGTYIATKLNLK